jgi:hypothetical protein
MVGFSDAPKAKTPPAAEIASCIKAGNLHLRHSLPRAGSVGCGRSLRKGEAKEGKLAPNFLTRETQPELQMEYAQTAYEDGRRIGPLLRRFVKDKTRHILQPYVDFVDHGLIARPTHILIFENLDVPPRGGDIVLRHVAVETRDEKTFRTMGYELTTPKFINLASIEKIAGPHSRLVMRDMFLAPFRREGNEKHASLGTGSELNYLHGASVPLPGSGKDRKEFLQKEREKWEERRDGNDLRQHTVRRPPRVPPRRWAV